MYSNSHKFIFFHVGKCAGTSIKKSLAAIKGLSYDRMKGHSSLAELQQCVRESGFDPEKYFTFSVTRNPWDRHVSLYYHMTSITKIHPNDPLKAKMEFKGSFEDFVYNSYVAKFDYSLVDYVIRYENLIDDFDQLCNHLNIKTPVLPHFDYNTGRPKVSYRSYYNSETQKKVSELYATDIDYFNYEF